MVESFSLSPEPGALTGRRRYGEILATRHPITPLDPTDYDVPWTERIVSAVIRSPHGPIEIHNAHIPAGVSGSRDGTSTKIETFEGIAGRFGRTCGTRRILCGDFNFPAEEHPDGSVVCWGGHMGSDGIVRAAPRNKRRQRQHKAEDAVIVGLADFDQGDAFRAVHGYEKAAYSYATHRLGKTFPPQVRSRLRVRVLESRGGGVLGRGSRSPTERSRPAGGEVRSG